MEKNWGDTPSATLTEPLFGLSKFTFDFQTKLMLN